MKPRFIIAVMVWRSIKMKYFVEVLDKETKEELGRVRIYWNLKTQTEFTTKAKAKTNLKNLTITANQKKRVHICNHASTGKNKACEIIE